MYSSFNRRSSATSFATAQASWKRSSALHAGVAASALLLSPFTAAALPTGGAYVGGAGNIGAAAGGVQTITQTSNRGVINWNTFNIDNGEKVNFVQPSANSITLNRVTASANPSQIFGTLNANGQVVISNPNGVVFGPNSRTDVAGLLATTANADTEKFMNATGKVDFDQVGSPSGYIETKAGSKIQASEKGLVALVAPQVKNAGEIIANKGTVVLAGAEQASFDLYGDGLIGFAGATTAHNGSVNHSGSINAHGGTVILTAVEAQNVVDSVVSKPPVEEATTLNSDGELVVKTASVKKTVSTQGEGSVGGGNNDVPPAARLLT